MTVSYNLDVSSSRSWTFLKLMFRWKGSIWKNVLSEFCWWIIGYYVCYGFIRIFEKDNRFSILEMTQKFDKQLDWIPLQFMLGFFVTIVVDRWKHIFHNIGFIDNAALRLATYMDGEDPYHKTVRRNIIRYMCLSQILVLRDIAVPVRKRFPTYEAIVEAGFINKSELENFRRLDNGFARYWVPINWCYHLVREQREKQNFPCDLFCHSVVEELRTFRENLQQLTNYDWVPVPLAYPQVVFLAVRVYFIICLFSRQYTTRPDFSTEWYVIVQNVIPIMTALQFFFCMGWLKVAEALLNPLGEDDDDFETNFIIDRNLAIGLAIVDDCRKCVPVQIRDMFGSGDRALDVTSGKVEVHPLIGSASELVVDEANPDHRKSSISSVNQGLRNLKQQVQRRLSRTYSSSVQPTVEDLEKAGVQLTEDDIKRLKERRGTTAGAVNLATLDEDEETSSIEEKDQKEKENGRKNL
ncbi:unnamed protein product [Bursaphelenchus xylophilus]|uniref:Bestrophin homolog n=1 Tax=Bursaphelenchus xylophilus TaxID=6326 RepID=A0A1I7SB75_BURXY|nr:unnamed protein product [Bursaphelenchus xylophilus]CAG9118692.1 unnamed protein product [Bursaphelenchus xylophilus]